MAQDAETNKVLREGELVAEYVETHGWQYVKQKFTDKILDLQSIKNLDLTRTATTLAKEIAIRNTVVDILLEIIREVEGRASQHKGNAPLGIKYEEEIIITKTK